MEISIDEIHEDKYHQKDDLENNDEDDDEEYDNELYKVIFNKIKKDDNFDDYIINNDKNCEKIILNMI